MKQEIEDILMTEAVEQDGVLSTGLRWKIDLEPDPELVYKIWGLDMNNVVEPEIVEHDKGTTSKLTMEDEFNAPIPNSTLR